MGFCGRCGANVRDDATYCPVCGAQLRTAGSPPPKKRGGINWVIVIIVAAIVALGSYYVVFNLTHEDQSTPAEGYTITIGVRDLVVYSDTGTLYTVMNDGKYYNPENERFDLDSPATTAYLCLNVTVNGVEQKSRTFTVTFNGNETTAVTDRSLISINVDNVSSVSILIYLETEAGSLISIMPDDQGQTGMIVNYNTSITSQDQRVSASADPHATGYLTFTCTPITA